VGEVTGVENAKKNEEIYIKQWVYEYRKPAN